MLDELEHLGFAKKTHPEIRSMRVLLVEVLDGDATARIAVDGFVHLAHAAPTDQATEQIRFEAGGFGHPTL
jgi:hypothetical protein